MNRISRLLNAALMKNENEKAVCGNFAHCFL